MLRIRAALIDTKLTGNATEVIWLTALKVIANRALTFALVTYYLFWTRCGHKRL
jgi:hypothetical protein